jgi:hypothetical protein
VVWGLGEKNPRLPDWDFAFLAVGYLVLSNA